MHARSQGLPAVQLVILSVDRSTNELRSLSQLDEVDGGPARSDRGRIVRNEPVGRVECREF